VNVDSKKGKKIIEQQFKTVAGSFAAKHNGCITFEAFVKKQLPVMKQRLLDRRTKGRPLTSTGSSTPAGSPAGVSPGDEGIAPLVR
jgi:hypothetical protein